MGELVFGVEQVLAAEILSPAGPALPAETARRSHGPSRALSPRRASLQVAVPPA